jgi:hypothetical protein
VTCSMHTIAASSDGGEQSKRALGTLPSKPIQFLVPLTVWIRKGPATGRIPANSNLAGSTPSQDQQKTNAPHSCDKPTSTVPGS